MAFHHHYHTTLGSPTPSVSWRRQNNAILPTGGIQYRGNVLTINSVKKEDRGTYYCVADNNIGKPAQRAVSVEIEFAPTVTQTPSPGKYSLIVYLSIDWLKKDNSNDNNSKII